MIDMTLPILVIVALMAFTGFAWLRLDDLLDRVAEAAPGSRMKRLLVRQVGAMAGWWLLVAGASLLFFGGVLLGGPFLALGALLVALAIVARHRGDAPLFWGAV